MNRIIRTSLFALAALASLLAIIPCGASTNEFKGASPLQWSLRMADSETARLGDKHVWKKESPEKWDYTVGLVTLSLLKLNAEYTVDFNGPKTDLDDVVNQFRLVNEHLYDKESGLYWHGWDEKHVQNWADKSTGRSPTFGAAPSAGGRWRRWMCWISSQRTTLATRRSSHPCEKPPKAS